MKTAWLVLHRIQWADVELAANVPIWPAHLKPMGKSTGFMLVFDTETDAQEFADEHGGCTIHELAIRPRETAG